MGHSCDRELRFAGRSIQPGGANHGTVEVYFGQPWRIRFPQIHRGAPPPAPGHLMSATATTLNLNTPAGHLLASRDLASPTNSLHLLSHRAMAAASPPTSSSPPPPRAADGDGDGVGCGAARCSSPTPAQRRRTSPNHSGGSSRKVRSPPSILFRT
jgi:hypothetical protein